MARAQAQRRRSASSRARRSASSAEDLMFFPKLRRRAKWVFLLLAIAFALGFVAFGVGTGVSGTSIGDVLRDFFTDSGSGAGDLDSARKTAEANPKDADAQIAYANALQAAGQSTQAVDVLQKYTTENPKDANALRQLATLWGAIAVKARNEAQRASVDAAQASLARAPAPSDSPFLQQVQQNKIADVISTDANNRASSANLRAQNAYREAAKSYEQLTLLTPDDPSVFLQLGVASQSAADYDSAIAAYDRFLELAPDDASAPLVKRELKVLKAQQKAGSSLLPSG
ncbi:MAG TPA: tetratricopeptide repeat protein [Gaiellaceae bacterium]|nr:tetratricopeptide repeat protein [Gaiellaceae bacterium]